MRNVPNRVLNVRELRRMIRFLSADGHRGVRRPMVGLLTRDDVFLLRLAATPLVVVHQPKRRVDRGGSTGRKDHPIERSGRQFCKFFRQPHRGYVGRVDKCAAKRKVSDLPRHCVCNFRAPVADIRAPQSGGSVKIAIALCVDDMDSVTACKRHASVFVERVEHRPGMHKNATCHRRRCALAQPHQNLHPCPSSTPLDPSREDPETYSRPSHSTICLSS